LSKAGPVSFPQVESALERDIKEGQGCCQFDSDGAVLGSRDGWQHILCGSVRNFLVDKTEVRVVASSPSGTVEGFRELGIMNQGEIPCLCPGFNKVTISVIVCIAPSRAVRVEITDDDFMLSGAVGWRVSPDKAAPWWLIDRCDLHVSESQCD